MIRRELPWPVITREVLAAIRSCNRGKKFVDTGKIAEYMRERPGLYPHFAGCTHRTALQRVATSLNKSGWAKFNLNSTRPGVFINPDVVDEITEGAKV